MKTLGLIGGTSWVSTIDYYQLINQQVNEQLGALNSAKLILYSVNFEEFRPPTELNKWGVIAEKLATIALNLERAGAECLVICANTPHLVADRIQEKLHIPLLHIAEATAAEIKRQGMRKVALLGTRVTMEQDFFRQKLLKKGIESIIPEAGDRDYIHESILSELAKGIFTQDTKSRYLSIMREMVNQGAEGIILGCTEIPMLLQPHECPAPVFDTMLIHATAAVEFALR